MYQICQHKNGDLMLVIKQQMSDPEDPVFIYDGGDTALLFRNWDSSLRFNNLSEQARSPLQNADEILVIEKQDECVIRTYIASIRFVRNVKSLIA